MSTSQMPEWLKGVLVVGGLIVGIRACSAYEKSNDYQPTYRYIPDSTIVSGFDSSIEDDPSDVSSGEDWNDYSVDDSSDLDCEDIGDEVWVGDDDPDGLDRDGDGWGCEGW